VLLPLTYADTYVASDQHVAQLGPDVKNPKKPEAVRVILDEATKRALLWVRGLKAERVTI